MTFFPDNNIYRQPQGPIPSTSGEAEATVDLKRTKRVRRVGDHNGSLDRLPPNANEAEQAALGCVMLSPNETMPEMIESLVDGADEFYDLRHQTIYRVMIEMYEAREALDVITIRQRLKDKQLLEQIGGDAYLAALPDQSPSAANVTYYTELIHDKYLLRRMVQTCTEIVGRIYECESDVPALMDEIERDILRIGESRKTTKMVPIKELVARSIATIESFQTRKLGLSGMPTGYPDLDKMIDGMHPEDYIVIAARPSMGKTSLAMNILEHVTCDQKLPTMMFSLEMSAEALTTRMICSRSRVNLRNVRDGFLAERDYPKLTGAAGRIASAPIYLDDSTGVSILQIRAKARRAAQQFGIRLIVIDYLQLISTVQTRQKNDSRQQQIADVSSGIKSLCKELKIPVIVLSQLNRDMEREKNRKPRLSDLRESGAIEQDADVVGMLYRPTGDEEDEESDAIPVNLMIAKQRNGPTGDVYLTFLKSYTRFESAAKVSDEDVTEQGEL